MYSLWQTSVEKLGLIMSEEQPEVYIVDLVNARKEHKCYECHGIIKAGERYYRHHGIWEKPETFKVCSDCETLYAEIKRECHLEPEEACFGYLVDNVFESGEHDWIKTFIEIKKKRGAVVRDWMYGRLYEKFK
jgi:hypothetical protein